MDGFTVKNQTDHSGIRSSQTRSSTGMVLKQTDSRGNVTTTETDLAGRPVQTTDSAGNVTTTSYLPCCDNPACITDALGERFLFLRHPRQKDGRVRHRHSAGLLRLRRSRSHGGVDYLPVERRACTSDPSNRTDGDTTAWLYDEATGLELKKNLCRRLPHLKTYDELNRLKTY